MYESQFILSKRHGEGKMTYVNGNVYQGNWKDDMKDGSGKEYIYKMVLCVGIDSCTGSWTNIKEATSGDSRVG